MPLRTRRGLVALVPLVLQLAFASCSAPSNPPRPPREGTQQLTVASFNLHFPVAGDPETTEAVGNASSDVVFLQEVSPHWEAALRQRYAGVYPHALFAPAGGASGLGVLSRFPLEERGVMPPVASHPAWLVRVVTPRADLYVLNVHLRAAQRPGQNILSGILSIASDHETEIRTFFENSHAPPDVVVGDFNEGPGGPAITWLEQRGFVDALDRYRPFQPTWRALGVFRATYDHILTRGPASALDAWVLCEGRSDHWPIAARLEIDSAPRSPP
jgi:endonuclease/exonuclease/phosphatase family metal-dependent hydrolase